MRKRLAILALTLAAWANADQVFVTAKGQKFYHTQRDCIALTRSHTVLVAEEKEAQSHGLTLCPICAHRHHSQTIRNENKNWATPEVGK